MDAKSRQVMAFYIGDRNRKSATWLWPEIPLADREEATFYTDQYVVYAGGIPAAEHQAMSKLASKTNYIEQFNRTRRQRVSGVLRPTVSFATKRANHSGAIKYFICHSNLTRAAA